MKSNLLSLFILCSVVLIPFKMVSQTTCPAPTNLTTTNITNTGATLAWTAPAGAVAYLVQYRTLTPAGTAWTNVTSQLTSVTLTTLLCGTAYEWHVAALCANGTTVPGTYSSMKYLTTTACAPPTCVPPTSLTTTNITATTATLGWTPVAGATGYFVQYHNGGGAWVNVTTQSASVTLTNLVCGTTYEWHVATVCGSATGNISAYAAAVAFTTTACTPPPCLAPTNLQTTNITATAATLSWTAPAGGFAYIVQYRPITNPASAWINVTVTTPNSILTLTNLVCGTHYEWHVAAYCNSNTGTTSPYSVTADFTTVACAPICVAPTTLTTTNITATGATLGWAPVAGATGYLVQYHANGAAWINVTSQSASVTLTNLICGTTYEWHVATVCGAAPNNLSPYSAGVAFTTTACTPPPCLAPTNLQTTNITATAATLSWTAPAGGFAYIVQYRPITNPASAWINVTVTTPNSILTLTNLVCGTHYEWHVAAYCNNSTGTTSPYSITADFTTAACTPSCIAPSALTTGNITTTGATLVWTPVTGAAGYLVQYHIAGGAWVNITTQSASVTLTNLVCGTTYEWHVATVCGSATGNISSYSAGVAFTTLPCTTTCAAPTNLHTTNNSTTGATLLWTGPVGVLSYIVQYRPITAAGATWITVTTQSASLTLANLLCGTHYEWHVATLCANGTTTPGPYSVLSDFTTLACTTNCDAPTNLHTTNINTTNATFSWTAPTGGFAYIVQYRPITNPASAWINVTAQTTSITLTNLACGTHYEWHIAAYCNNNTSSTSPYAAIIDFTTAPCTTNCVAPTGLTAGTATSAGVTIAWTPVTGAVGYLFQYHAPGGAWINVTTQSAFTTITALTCGTVYECHVATVCGTAATNISPYSTAISFTSLPCANVCPVPVDLNSAAVTASSTSRLLSWGSTGATLYNARYRIVNDVNWISTSTGGNAKTITGLTLASHYEWQVRSVCTPVSGATVSSAWSASAFFETPVSRGVYPNPASGTIIQLPVIVENDARINIIISDRMGRVISTIAKTIATGGEIVDIDIDIANLQTGMYFIKISNAGKNEVQKLFITR